MHFLTTKTLGQKLHDDFDKKMHIMDMSIRQINKHYD
jgi:hypothetical protein